MEVTRELLKRMDACTPGYDFWCQNCEDKPIEEQLRTLVRYNFNWAAWLLVRILNQKQNKRFAIHCIESALFVFEKAYPKDNRPRQAVDSAKLALDNYTDKNMTAARTAGKEAWEAYLHAHYDTDESFSYASRRAVCLVADSASKVFGRTECFEDIVKDTVYAVCQYSTSQFLIDHKKKLIEYGISLIKAENNGEDERTPTDA